MSLREIVNDAIGRRVQSFVLSILLEASSRGALCCRRCCWSRISLTTGQSLQPPQEYCMSIYLLSSLLTCAYASSTVNLSMFEPLRLSRTSGKVWKQIGDGHDVEMIMCVCCVPRTAPWRQPFGTKYIMLRHGNDQVLSEGPM